MTMAIRIRGVGKRYRINTVGGSSLRDAFSGIFHRQQREDFWALRDLHVEVPIGSALGIIGHNGAGKSTLLKILSRITRPTTGEIELRGRVGSLLEVGTGFHPDLTGRDNVYFNGAILGMSRAEVARRFDEIVAFAEVDRFIDMPVKTYSSGMFMRLAFSVAAHLDTEILFMDEVLAVGDAGFTQKCLRRLAHATAKEGRTVLLVSHNLAAVQRLCQQALLLENGQMKAFGRIGEVLDSYLSSINQPLEQLVKDQLAMIAHHPAFSLESFSLVQGGQSTEVIKNGSPFTVRIDCQFHEVVEGGRLVIEVHDRMGRILFIANHDCDLSEMETMRPGRYRYEVHFPADMLAAVPHTLVFKAAGASTGLLIRSELGIRLTVNVLATGIVHRLNPADHEVVAVAPHIPWSHHQLDDIIPKTMI